MHLIKTGPPQQYNNKVTWAYFVWHLNKLHTSLVYVIDVNMYFIHNAL